MEKSLDVQHPALYTKYRNYVEKALSILSSAPDTDLMRRRPKNKVKFNGDGSVHISSDADQLINEVSVAKMEEISKSIEYKEATDELNKCGQFIGCYGIAPQSFLQKFIERTNGYAFDESIYNIIYKGYEEFLLTHNSEHQSCVYLENFEIDSVVFELDENIYIKKLSETEFSEMLNNSRMLFSFFDSMVLRHCIQVNYCVAENPGLDDGVARQKNTDLLINIFFAMRVFKTGNLSGPQGFSYALSWTFMGGRFGLNKSLTTSRKGGNKYSLNGQEKEELKLFWKKYRALLPLSKDFLFFDTAIKRFNSAYVNEKVEDRLIDFMISFEALYLKGDEREELSYRLALRTACNLAIDSGTRKTIFRDMKLAYTLRSLTVHGKDNSKISIKILEHHKTVDEFVVCVEEYLRRSIKQFMELIRSYPNQEVVINSLDEKILGDD